MSAPGLAAPRQAGDLDEILAKRIKRFVSNMKDAISYFGFREVFRGRHGDVA